MASDASDVFDENQLLNGDVACEDGDASPHDKVEEDAGSVAGSKPGSAKDKQRPGAVRSASKPSGASKAQVPPKPKKKKKVSEKSGKVLFWLETKYDVLPEVCAMFEEWREASCLESDPDLIWSDQAIPADRFTKMKTFQKVNHFVGMSAITRKNNLGRNLLRMKKVFPKDYRFFPDTWILPTDLSDFKAQFTAQKNKTFIIKPDNGCQGKGIFLVRDFEKMPEDYTQTMVAQRYIHKPFLLDGHKFDLRLFVLVSGCDPLRIFLHKGGLVRLASEEYVEPKGKNLCNSMMHLTNYAINCENPNFKQNINPDDAQDGHKRSLHAVLAHMRDMGHDVDLLIEEIDDLIVKTLMAVQPSLSHFYHSCQPEDLENSMAFEILGFDVMLDHKCKPWLIEVNHAPSFGTDSELDQVVKSSVLRDAFELLNINPESRKEYQRACAMQMKQKAMGTTEKRTLQERQVCEEDFAHKRNAWEDEHLNGYRKLFPTPEKEKMYMPIHDAAIDIWETLMGGTSRRPIRLTTEDKQQEEEKKDSEKDKEGKKQAAERMRAAVERLSSCGRGAYAKKRKEEKEAEEKAAREKEEAEAAANIEGSNVPSSSSADAAHGGGDHIEKAAETIVKKSRRVDAEVGDRVKVQTNLGWEQVTVRWRYPNGKFDIEFEDGEMMREVLPRILRPQGNEEKDSDAKTGGKGSSSSGGATSSKTQASGSSSSTTASESASAGAPTSQATSTTGNPGSAPGRPGPSSVAGRGRCDTAAPIEGLRKGVRSTPPPPPHSDRGGAGRRPQPPFVSHALAALRAQQSMGLDGDPMSPASHAAMLNDVHNGLIKGTGAAASGANNGRQATAAVDAMVKFDQQLSRRIKAALGDPSLAALLQGHQGSNVMGIAMTGGLGIQNITPGHHPQVAQVGGGMSNEAPEARLRQQLNQLINIRPITTRRSSSLRGESGDRTTTTCCARDWSSKPQRPVGRVGGWGSS